jgi:hypothetical protein
MFILMEPFTIFFKDDFCQEEHLEICSNALTMLRPLFGVCVLYGV